MDFTGVFPAVIGGKMKTLWAGKCPTPQNNETDDFGQ